MFFPPIRRSCRRTDPFTPELLDAISREQPVRTEFKFLWPLDSHWSAPQLQWEWKIRVIFKKTNLTSISRKKRKIQIMFYTSQAPPPPETHTILSRAFPEAMDNKEVIPGDNVQWFTPITELQVSWLLLEVLSHKGARKHIGAVL
jgi:hypothetical protein